MQIDKSKQNEIDEKVKEATLIQNKSPGGLTKKQKMKLEELSSMIDQIPGTGDPSSKNNEMSRYEPGASPDGYSNRANHALVAQANSYMRARLWNFISIRNRHLPPYQHPSPLNWSSDACSLPWVALALKDIRYANRVFYSGCIRHDFGYRNYPAGLRLDPSEQARLWVDNVFRKDALDLCSNQGWRIIKCRGYVNIYYWTTRRYGRRWWR